MAQNSEQMEHLGREFAETGLKSATAAVAGAQAIAAHASDYAKKSVETGVAAFGKLAAAGSIESALEIQADYVRRSYQDMVAEATTFSGLYADMLKEAWKPFESIVAKAG